MQNLLIFQNLFFFDVSPPLADEEEVLVLTFVRECFCCFEHLEILSLGGKESRNLAIIKSFLIRILILLTTKGLARHDFTGFEVRGLEVKFEDRASFDRCKKDIIRLGREGDIDIFFTCWMKLGLLKRTLF